MSLKGLLGFGKNNDGPQRDNRQGYADSKRDESEELRASAGRDRKVTSLMEEENRK